MFVPGSNLSAGGTSSPLGSTKGDWSWGGDGCYRKTGLHLHLPELNSRQATPIVFPWAHNQVPEARAVL